MPHRFSHRLAGLRVPHLRHSVLRGGNKPAAIAAETRVLHGALVPQRFDQRLECLRVPNTTCAVHGSRQHPLPVRAELAVRDVTLSRWRFGEQSARGHVAELRPVISGVGGEQPLPVRTEADERDIGPMLDGLPMRLAGVRVPWLPSKRLVMLWTFSSACLKPAWSVPGRFSGFCVAR